MTEMVLLILSLFFLIIGITNFINKTTLAITEDVDSNIRFEFILFMLFFVLFSLFYYKSVTF